MVSCERAPEANVDLWKRHWQDEADAAFLYRVLSVVEPSPDRAALYARLAGVEERHVALWAQLLGERGAALPAHRPSLRARMLAAAGRTLGTRALLPFLLSEEAREMKGYLREHRDAPDGRGGETTLTLARESAQHAETLGRLLGRVGEPWHRTASGGFLRNVVYGFNDGLTANFGLVMGVIGAGVDPPIVLISGLAGLVADALSMGSSGYLAAQSEREVYAHEIALEREEIRLMPELEAEEVAIRYEAMGLPAAAAREAARTLLQEPDRALEEKTRGELGIGEAAMSPVREGWLTGFATAFGALIPILPFFFLPFGWAVGTSLAVSMASHFAVGAARSFFTGRGIFRSGLDMFAVGLGVAAVGYGVGELIERSI